MNPLTFTWQSDGRFPGEDLAHTVTVDSESVRWATVTDEYDDDRPYTADAGTAQPTADFLALGPVERAPIKVLEDVVGALGKPAAWLEPLRLQYAARDGDLTATRGLLRIAGEHKDAAVRGATPLSAALEAEQLETAACLVEAKCNPNVRLGDGGTALHVAARHTKTVASTRVLEALFTAGADPMARNAAGETPLVAGLAGHLCKEGVMLFAEHRKAINVASADGTTPLIAEARGWCRPSVVRLLVGAGADVNARSKDGWSALLWAITKHDLWFVKMLIEAKADVNVVGQPHKHGQPARSALALAEAQAAAASASVDAAGPPSAASIKHKSAELAAQIVDALRTAGAKG